MGEYWHKKISGIFLLALVFVLTACQNGRDSSAPPEENTPVQILWPQLWSNHSDSSGGYSFSVQNLMGLDSLTQLSGTYAQFYKNPNVNSIYQLVGAPAKSRFIENNGVWVPADTLSMQLSVLYAHMQNFAELDKTVGAEGVNQWPRSVGVAVNWGEGSQNNAFYDGQSDSMLFLTYSEDKLPLAINAGVLAHEHFHSLFQKLVLNTLSQKDQLAMSAYNQVLLRGINEGLADFWGWLYTGDADFISRSLKEEGQFRSLNTKQESPEGLLSSARRIQQAVSTVSADKKAQQFYLHYSYILGNQFAQLLKMYVDFKVKNGIDPQSVAQEKSSQQKQAIQLARTIIKVLPELASIWRQQNNLFEPKDLFPLLLQFDAQIGAQECQFMLKIMNSSSSLDNRSYRCNEDHQLLGELNDESIPKTE